MRGVAREEGGKDVHEFFIPVPHFAACVPEGSVHAYEIAPFLLFERLFEAFSTHRVCSYDVEFVVQLGV